MGSRGALDGVRVLDLTQVLAGPFCTQFLADHGAEVIKIEPPYGDESNKVGPYREDDRLRLQGGYYQSVNRNKLGMVLDLKQDSARDVLLKLVESADVLVENYRAGVMDKLGLGYETLAEKNPRLIYAAIRGFGDPRSGESPYTSWPAFDVVAQAMGGIIGITGENPEHPVKVGPGIGDMVPGLMCAFGIVSALFEAQKSGQGQFIDIGMVDGILALCERIVHQYSYTNNVPKPQGNRHPILCPFGLFEARDGWITIGASHLHHWEELCRVVGREDLVGDTRFTSNSDRLQHAEFIYDLIETFTRQKTKMELLELMGGKIPMSPIYDAADVFSDAHFSARSMLAELRQPGCSEPVIVAGVPVKMSRTPGAVRHRAPLFGEHTDAVL